MSQMLSTNRVSPRKSWSSDITSPDEKYGKQPVSSRSNKGMVKADLIPHLRPQVSNGPSKTEIPLSPKLTNETKQTKKTSNKDYPTKEWNIKKSTQLAVTLFADSNKDWERSELLKDLLKFVVKNDFWLFVESDVMGTLEKVHKCLIHSTFDAKDKDPAIFGLLTGDKLGAPRRYFLFDLDGIRYIEKNKQKKSGDFNSNKTMFSVAIVVSVKKDFLDSHNPPFNAVVNLEGGYNKDKDDIALSILMAIRNNIKDLNKKEPPKVPSAQSTSSAYSSDGYQSVSNSVASLMQEKVSTEDNAIRNPEKDRDSVTTTEKQSNDQILEYFLLCLKVNSLEKAREFAEIWKDDEARTRTVINTAVADDHTEFIRYMLEENLAILNFIDQDIFSKNTHHCKYHQPETAYLALANVEKKMNGSTQRTENNIVQENTAWNNLISRINPKHECKVAQCEEPGTSLAERLWGYFFRKHKCEGRTGENTDSGLAARLWRLLYFIPKYNCSQETLQGKISWDIYNMRLPDVEDIKPAVDMKQPEDKETDGKMKQSEDMGADGKMKQSDDMGADGKMKQSEDMGADGKMKQSEDMGADGKMKQSENKETDRKMKQSLDKETDEKMKQSHMKAAKNATPAEEKIFLTNKANKLFEISVRARKTKLAKVLWRRVSHPTGAALYACGILKVLRFYETDEDKQLQLKKDFDEFEKRAVDTLMRTYQKYPEETIRLLIFSMPEWGNTTCIYLAINNYNLNFLSQMPCKELNDRLWNWGTHVKNECMWHVNEDMKESEQNIDKLQKQNVDIIQKQNDGGKYHEKNSQNSTVLQVENKNDCPPLSSTNGDSGEEQEEIEHCRVCDECSDHKKLAKISIWTMFCFCTSNKYDPIMRKLLAPSVLVLLQLLGHLVFLVLYAMLLVSVLHPASFHWLEFLVWAWIITFLCEEFNQYLRNPLFKWKQLFFIVELISLIFFFGGYGLRIAVFYNPTSVTMINYTHVILGMSYIGFSVGLLEICYSSEFFGPLMAMFKNMLLKLLRFMVIILVFFFSYAVASESVLYPRSKLTPLLAYNVIRKAFWGMFGEFFLDELESQEGDIDEPTCTNDPSLYEDYGQLRCPTGTGRYFVPILLGFYFLTINILLFNIIIAVFNSEIKRIEKKAEGVWRRHSLKFTTKYHKMLFPAPIFLWIFPFLVKFVYAKEKFSPFLKEITEAEKPLQLRLSRIQDEIREQYIVDMAGQDLRDETINISCKVNCPHTDSPEYQQTFSRPVRGDPVNEESAVAVLTTTRPLMSSRRKSDGSWATQRNRFFAVRTRYKYGLRWDCVRVRPLSRKQLRHDVDPNGLNVKITSS